MAAFEKGFSLLIVRNIIHNINAEKSLRPCECFDLIAGTSTGGLIASMLGTLRMSAQEAIAAYVRLAPRIFPLKGDMVSKAIKAVVETPLFDAKVLEMEVKTLVSAYMDKHSANKQPHGGDALFCKPIKAEDPCHCSSLS
jgi:patatin-like phospholipase/acyl hydrolase